MLSLKVKLRGLAEAAKSRFQRIDVRFLGRIPLATLAYLLVVIGVYWVAHKELELFALKPTKITTWDDLRTFGLGLSGFIAVWLAIVGSILSTARTKAMEDANRQQLNDHRQRLYMDALETLNRKRDYQKASAIESLRKLGVEEDGEYRTQAIEVLAAFVRSTARIDDKNTKRRLDPSGTALNLASALHALSEIQSKMEFSASLFHENIQLFENLDLSELKFTTKKSISRMNFRACDFSGSNFMSVKFTDVNFWDCDFNKAILSYAHFAPGPGPNINLSNSTFVDAWVNFTNFEDVFTINEGQFLRVRYVHDALPKNVPKTSLTASQRVGVLPTPFVRDDADPSTGHYLSIEETREYYAESRDFEKKNGRPYRPLHKDRRPVPIIHPDCPDDVILD